MAWAALARIEMDIAGQMNRPDLRVRITQIYPSELRGSLVGEGALAPAEAEVRVFLDPRGTAFMDASILGGGRVYEDRIEIDLTLGEERSAVLQEAFGMGKAVHLDFQVRAITGVIFRVEAVELA